MISPNKEGSPDLNYYMYFRSAFTCTQMCLYMEVLNKFLNLAARLCTCNSERHKLNYTSL